MSTFLGEEQLSCLRQLVKSERANLRKRFGKQAKIFKWITTADYPFILKNGARGVVPRGFVADGCSGGGCDRIGQREWLIHDWLYASAGRLRLSDDRESLCSIDELPAVSRADADSVFEWRLFHRWALVRMFANSHWGSDLEKLGEPEMLKLRVHPEFIDGGYLTSTSSDGSGSDSNSDSDGEEDGAGEDSSSTYSDGPGEHKDDDKQKEEEMTNPVSEEELSTESIVDVE
jgi:hypothetical protein